MKGPECGKEAFEYCVFDETSLSPIVFVIGIKIVCILQYCLKKYIIILFGKIVGFVLY